MTELLEGNGRATGWWSSEGSLEATTPELTARSGTLVPADGRPVFESTVRLAGAKRLDAYETKAATGRHLRENGAVDAEDSAEFEDPIPF